MFKYARRLCVPLTEPDDPPMRWFYQPLLLLLASSTDSDLAKQVEYLKAENGILRRLVGKRPYLDEPDKRLLVKIAQKGSTRTHQSKACPGARSSVPRRGRTAPSKRPSPC